ncbi:hypothetical protein BZA70DRAFT_264857 [Myxozyma melibiosi]|uniref:Myb-like domain-containing protein n=1 Tax=Myxozyma melibiosi TaxID=54550 RepID=A0ABR1FCB4_9ASCO
MNIDQILNESNRQGNAKLLPSHLPSDDDPPKSLPQPQPQVSEDTTDAVNRRSSTAANASPRAQSEDSDGVEERGEKESSAGVEAIAGDKSSPAVKKDVAESLQSSPVAPVEGTGSSEQRPIASASSKRKSISQFPSFPHPPPPPPSLQNQQPQQQPQQPQHQHQQQPQHQHQQQPQHQHEQNFPSQPPIQYAQQPQPPPFQYAYQGHPQQPAYAVPQHYPPYDQQSYAHVSGPGQVGYITQQMPQPVSWPARQAQQQQQQQPLSQSQPQGQTWAPSTAEYAGPQPYALIAQPAYGAYDTVRQPPYMPPGVQQQQQQQQQSSWTVAQPQAQRQVQQPETISQPRTKGYGYESQAAAGAEEESQEDPRSAGSSSGVRPKRRKAPNSTWTIDEDRQLVEMVLRTLPRQDFGEYAQVLNKRDAQTVRYRWKVLVRRAKGEIEEQ